MPVSPAWPERHSAWWMVDRWGPGNSNPPSTMRNAPYLQAKPRRYHCSLVSLTCSCRISLPRRELAVRGGGSPGRRWQSGGVLAVRGGAGSRGDGVSSQRAVPTAGQLRVAAGRRRHRDDSLHPGLRRAAAVLRARAHLRRAERLMTSGGHENTPVSVDRAGEGVTRCRCVVASRRVARRGSSRTVFRDGSDQARGTHHTDGGVNAPGRGPIPGRVRRSWRPDPGSASRPDAGGGDSVSTQVWVV